MCSISAVEEMGKYPRSSTMLRFGHGRGVCIVREKNLIPVYQKHRRSGVAKDTYRRNVRQVDNIGIVNPLHH